MLVPTTHVTLITAHWVPAPSGATTKAQPPRGGHPTRGLRQRRLVGPRGHQGFHLLAGQLHSSCSTPMWHQGLGLVGMRILRLSKECATKLNRDQSIQPQMLKDKGKNNLGEQKTSCKTTRRVVRQRKSGQAKVRIQKYEVTYTEEKNVENSRNSGCRRKTTARQEEWMLCQ